MLRPGPYWMALFFTTLLGAVGCDAAHESAEEAVRTDAINLPATAFLKSEAGWPKSPP